MFYQRLKKTLTLFGFSLIWSYGLVGAQPFTKKQDEFANELKTRLEKYNLPPAQAFLKQFLLDWESGMFTPQDKDTCIAKINYYMQEKGWRLYPHVTQFISTLATIRRPESKVRIQSRNFFKVTDSCAKFLVLDETYNYLRWLEKFCPQARVVETAIFSWRITQADPTLVFKSDYVSQLDKVVSFPALEFSNTDIVFRSAHDSTVIQKTSGYLNLFSRKFYGKGGRYDWTRVGLPLDEVYCELDKFVADLTLIDFSADSVRFFYRGLLNKPLKGHLQEHLAHESVPEKAQFPYFRSDEGDVTIENFVPNVKYEGGFSLRGVTKIGSQTATRPATLTIKNNGGKPVLRTESAEVLLNPKKMTTEHAAMTLFLPEGDSMYHPTMNLHYEVETQDLSLSINRKERESRQPITNSYLKYFLFFDAIKWNPNKDTLSFTATVDKEHKSFAVESYDFYRSKRFWQYKGILSFHPIGIIYRYYWDNINRNKKLASKENKRKKREETRTNYEDEFENYFEKQPEAEEQQAAEPEPEPAKPTDMGESKREFTVAEILRKYGLLNEKEHFIKALDDIVSGGFIEYNREIEMITIREPLFKWARAAAGQKDYDAISIVSQVSSGDNAQLSYEKGRMDLRGVPSYTLSDSQYVRFVPTGEKITLLKDRDIECSGLLEAGKLNLLGPAPGKFHFVYDDYKILCDSIKYLTFAPQRDPNYKPTKKDGGPSLIDGLKRLKIEQLKGAVYINKYNNKSSKKAIREYSIFDCYSEAYVNWADSSTQKGVYNKEKLYFTVEPFVIDSLEIFNIEALEFMGEFNCSEIMPAFRDTLKPVADRTYGVKETLPEEGVEVYKGKGRFYNQIQMDGFALHGKGQLDYLSSVAKADTFVFHFDSVMAHTTSFFLPAGNFQGVYYPEIKVDRIYYKWYPKKDRLVLDTKREAMAMYNGRALFRGQMVVTPLGVKGQGTVIIGQEEFESKDITFDEKHFTMENGTYYLSDTSVNTKRHLIAKKVSAKRDLESEKTDFLSSEKGKANITFPLQKYTTSLTVGSFDKATGEIKLGVRPIDKQKTGFYTTDSAQHKLHFPAKSAEYKMSEEKIRLKGVDSIFVADAIVYPDSAQATVLPTGSLQEFENASIVCDTATRMHNLFSARVQILSGINYRATAIYKYKFKGMEQQIIFEDITVRPDTVTTARGVIPEDQGFFITERFFYKDTITLVGNRKYLDFKGAVKIQSSNPALKDEWFKIDEKDVNPDSVVIRINQAKLGDLTVGLHFMHERTNFYSRFLEKKHSRYDLEVVSATGAITFDPYTKEFRIGLLEKLKNQQYKGNVVSFQDSLNIITSKGYIKFPYHTNKEINFFPIEIAGSWRQDRENLTSQTNFVMDLSFPPQMKIPLDNFALKCKEFAFSEGDQSEISTDRIFLESIAELIDKKDSLEVRTRLLAAALAKEEVDVAAINVAKDVPGSFLLSHVQFYYCDSLGTGYLYSDKPIGLLGINGKSLNKKIKAKFLYTLGIRNPNGTYQPDKCQLYFEINDYEWFYIEFKDNVMKTRSTNNKYNEDVNLEATKLNKKNKGQSKKEFTLSVATEEEVSKFIGDFSAGFALSGCGK